MPQVCTCDTLAETHLWFPLSQSPGLSEAPRLPAALTIPIRPTIGYLGSAQQTNAALGISIFKVSSLPGLDVALCGSTEKYMYRQRYTTINHILTGLQLLPEWLCYGNSFKNRKQGRNKDTCTLNISSADQLFSHSTQVINTYFWILLLQEINSRGN